MTDIPDTPETIPLLSVRASVQLEGENAESLHEAIVLGGFEKPEGFLLAAMNHLNDLLTHAFRGKEIILRDTTTGETSFFVSKPLEHAFELGMAKRRKPSLRVIT